MLIRRGFTMQISEKILAQNDRISNLIFCGQKLRSEFRPFVRVKSKRLYYANLGKDLSTERSNEQFKFLRPKTCK